MKYDATVIEEFSARLYSKAKSVVVSYTVLGMVIGLFCGAIGKGMGMIVGSLVLGAVGFTIGTERAFQYKLQAQTALCQVQIEQNTRKTP
jgi:hypothetical protein